MTTTTAVRVCAWCGAEGAGMCPDCAEALVKIKRELQAIDKFTKKNVELGRQLYLTSRWADRISGRWVCRNSECGVEPLVLGAECPTCGCRGRRHE